MATPDERPNVLLICVDQWRGDCLSIDGHPVVRTPYLDRLASRGSRFRHAYSATPTCIPARTALMTGLSQESHRRVGYLDGVPFEHEVTLPAVLRGAGYQTQAIGKLHMPTTGSAATPCRPGRGPAPRRCTRPRRRRSSCTCRSTGRIRPTTRPGGRSRPTLDTPPYRPVVGDWWQEYADHRDDHNPEALVASLDPQTLHRARAGYYGHMTHLDQQINRFLEALAEFGLAKNTYVAFVSDHGEMLGEHHLFRKGFPYEGSARIPFLLHGPPASGICPFAHCPFAHCPFAHCPLPAHRNGGAS
jgi:arylsulfatase A-like enzyme